MSFFETNDGVAIHYEELGQGRPLVFVHGWAMSGMVWNFQRELADRHRLIAMDLRGHGQSASSANITLEAFANDLIEFFTRLDLHDAVLVGWSMGVQVVLQAFQPLRPRLAGLVLVGGTPRFSAVADFPHGLPPVEVKGMGLRLRRDYQKTMGDFFKSMFAEGEPDREQYQRIVHEMVMKGRSPEPEMARKALQVLADADLRPILSGVDRPVLLIHGSRDTICLTDASRYMAEKLPMARLAIVDGGHAPFLARPAEFNNLIKGFLEEINGGH
ncbi:alpha/beta fold hydrolase [Geotalea sp. SG265]|uniref:alpha/beta fold hydrolase n=1 Tax=Geotalea sp. SG265 TaxID=2922867 RepID=UPI001FAF483F|nr:alpha/beta fold hydrolase [Geotalea sp. SG265]